VRKPLVSKAVSTEAEDIAGTRYQAMNGEDIADWYDTACAVVRSTVRKLTTSL
jgi:hypothetical protein